MLKPLLDAEMVIPGPPVIHSLNPIDAIGAKTLLLGGELVLEPGMTFALEPGAIVGRRRVMLGGTVIVGDDAAIELNPYTAQLLTARG